MTNLKFKIIKDPKVSIIIPVYNQIDYTLKCLKSIQKAKDSTSIEIIVVDDCSTDDTEQTLSKIDGIIYHRNTVNLGFVRNNNLAAKMAKGEYLFLLNNDTEVTDGYLEWLLKTFEKYPETAVAGSKLVYADGTLQEAGSHLYKTGNGFNYGKFQSPDNYNYNFVREVDYCSGAAILIKKSIFEELGMFDEEYAPAYYEDSDFQFKTKRAGYKNYYQPKSVVIHYEGISNGKDLGKETTGVKKYQEVNRSTFLSKHGEYINENGYDEDYSQMDNQIFPKDKEHIFFFEDQLVRPDCDSGSQRCFNLLMILQERFQVTFIPRNQVYDEKYFDLLTQNKIRVLINKNNNPLIDLTEFFSKNQSVPKYIILSRPETAIDFFEIIKINFPGIKVIYDTVDMHHVRWESMLEILDPEDEQFNDKKNWLEKAIENYKSIETFVCQSSDEVWAITNEEHDYLVNNLDIDSDKIKLIPNILDTNPSESGYEGRKDMMFIGNFFHIPNLNAIQYYVNKIAPEIKKRNLDITLNIIGSNAQRISNMKLEKSNLLGFIEDVDPYFNTSLFAFYPLIDGAGMKGKVTQALALGLPVVTTDIGAQGYENASEYMLIGNTPEELVDCMQRYMSDKNLWLMHRKKGLEYIKKHLSTEAVRKVLSAL